MEILSFSAPFDVLLPAFPLKNEGEIDTVIQPDISVICDPSKIVERGCLGTPENMMKEH